MRHDVVVVAVAKNGRESVIARRSLIPPAAMTQWKALLDERPALASRTFYFLMMTSGVTLGGADEIREQYVDYVSRTQRVGMAFPSSTCARRRQEPRLGLRSRISTSRDRSAGATWSPRTRSPA
ncbi:MAG: hypothetical protein IPF73_05620 [Betaproteobacteria bacterium]|nr:hypothetical protein [Betaproteobacteria bacterium]